MTTDRDPGLGVPTPVAVLVVDDEPAILRAHIDTRAAKEFVMLDFLVSNWFWLLFLAAMLFMHLGHGGTAGAADTPMKVTSRTTRPPPPRPTRRRPHE